MTAALGPPPFRASPEGAASRVRGIGRVDGTAVALTVVVAAGTVLRVWGLGRSKLDYDESFTAMAGRMPAGRLVAFLTAHDSHPPLDYLIRAPLARAGVSELWFRMPSAVCSIAALALLAAWLRPRGRVAVVAVGLFALSAFEIAHGRDARMYAELELLGVALAVVADRWRRAPRRSQAALAAVLVLAGLFTHVSMLLLAAGLVTSAGVRRDRAAWEWRVAIALPVVVWAATWGPHFLVQVRGGHSAWIPSTTVSALVTALARSVTYRSDLAVVVVAGTAAGAWVLGRRDRELARVWVAGFAVPVAVGAIVGLVEPVVLDRTFTLMAWAPPVALAFLVDALGRHRRWLAAAVVGCALVLLVPDAMDTASATTGPTAPLDALAARVRPGDVVAVRPASKAPELEWSLAVRTGTDVRPVTVAALPHTYALRLTGGPATGRVWYLDWRAHDAPFLRSAAPGCASPWRWGGTHIDCLTGRHVAATGA